MIFIVDDDDAVRDSLKLVLELDGYDVTDFSDGKAFLDSVGSVSASCLLLDLQMPKMDGLAVLEEMGRRKLDLPVIVLTGKASPSDKARALELGVHEVFDKPVPHDELLGEISRAVAGSPSIH